MYQCIERPPPGIHEHAKSKQGRAADPVLAMDQYLFPALRMITHELHALLEMLMTGGLHVGGRQVQKLDSGGFKHCSVVALLGPEIDDGADLKPVPEVLSEPDWEAAADRDPVRNPVEVWRELAAHRSIFFFNILTIFFFIISTLVHSYCCLSLITAVVAVTNGTTKLRNCSASV